MNQKDVSIVYVRVCAMWMIVGCHLMTQAHHPLANIAAMFLNVGVELFFLISAYLYGQRKIRMKIIPWYKKRFCRIAVPYYVFLGLLLCIYVFQGLHIDVFHWFIQLLILQGCQIYVWGAEHLWFLTILLFCYLLTPLLQWLEDKFSARERMLCFGISVAAQAFATFYISTQLGRYWLLVNFYMICYELGVHKLKCKTIKQAAVAVLLGLFGIAGRLIGKIYFDETVFYNIFISGITHCMLGISIFFMIQFLAPKDAGKVITFFDSISYEVYLVHYMLIVGPISLFNCTDNFIVNCGIVLVATIAIASLIHFCAKNVLNREGKK